MNKFLNLIRQLAYQNLKSETGQALITLIFFVVIATVVISAAVTVLFINNLSATTSEQGTLAYYIAESGAEDGYLRILRNPCYTTPTTTPTPAPLVVGSGTVSLSITNTGCASFPVNITITSIGTLNNISKKIVISAVYNTTGSISITTWKDQ